MQVFVRAKICPDLSKRSLRLALKKKRLRGTRKLSIFPLILCAFLHSRVEQCDNILFYAIGEYIIKRKGFKIVSKDKT